MLWGRIGVILLRELQENLQLLELCEFEFKMQKAERANMLTHYE